MAEDTFDFISICMDEIALEGLDGITISALWTRLQERPKHFPIALDQKSKSYLWNFIASKEEIEFFALPSPRSPLQLFDRYKHLDMDIGVVIECDDIPEDIYPFKEVSENGVRGSCATFHSRNNISAKIRYQNKVLPLEAVVAKWGEKLVLVASQKERNKALMGSEVNPILEITDFQYCLLERIGRSRYQGEVTVGKAGLNIIKGGARTLHYYYTALIHKNLITKQVHYQRYSAGGTHNGNLLHLTRFYVERLSKMDVMMKEMCKLLMKKPHHRETSDVLKQELGMTKGATFKKMINHQRLSNPCFKIEIVPYKTMYPNSPKEEHTTNHNKEKFVRVIELIKPYQEDAEDQERDDDEYDDCDKDVASSADIIYDSANHVCDRPLLHHAYRVIESSGPEGITADELRKKMTLPKLDIRFILKALVKKKSIIATLLDVGKQRLTKYISKYFQGTSDHYQKIIQERKQILEISQSCKLDQTDEFFLCKIEKTISGNTDQTNESVMFEEQYGDFDRISFGKDVQQCYNSGPEQSLMTYRLLKRANLIMQALKSTKLIEGTLPLQKLIQKEEEKEGIQAKIDKKSLLRIINKLAKDNYIRFIKTIIKHENQEKSLHLVCDPSVGVDDPIVQQVIDKAKFRYFRICQDKKSETSVVNKENENVLSTIEASVKQFKMLYGKNVKTSKTYLPSIGRIYGAEPKFAKMKTLHEFLFYLVYDYRSSTPKNHPDISTPTVYNDCKTWKMFVPPITKHRGVPEGWCFLSDIFLCMPLSIFIKLVNLTYKVEGLMEYLNDPIKRYYLIPQLPNHLRSDLLYNRRFLFSVHEIATRLSFMGLLSFGPQKIKEKDQVFVYIHKNIKIKDTILSSPGYLHISTDIEYPIKEYHFDLLDSVEAFWLDFQNICFRTPLGSYLSSQGQRVTIINIFKKPDMIEASRNHEFNEIKDNGFVPGDGMGAAGLDSSLFAHLKRNWVWPATQKKLKLNSSPEQPITQTKETCIGKNYMEYLVKSKDRSVENPYRSHRLRLQRLNKKILGTQMGITVKNQSKESKSSQQKSKKRKATTQDQILAKRARNYCEVRTIYRNYPKFRKPYYDEKDKSALNNMLKMRVDWSPQEDSFLLLCKVASCFIDPDFPRMVVPYTVVRDLLYKHLPDVAKNKTSRACQRRVRYMLLNPTTASNVSVFLGEAKQNRELVEQCQKPMPPKTNEKEWATTFIKVVQLLLTKFTSKTQRSKMIHLPSSIEEFHKYYKINMADSLLRPKSLHKNPEDLTDISFSVLYSVVMSSLSAQGDKVNWSYILYKIYQQYSESLLNSVLSHLLKESLITKSKFIRKKGLFSSIPYNLSIKYKNYFKTRYTPCLFNEAYDLYTKLSSSTDDIGVQLVGEIKPGYCALVLSLLATDSLKFDIQIPDQIILFDNQLSKQQRSKFIQQIKHLNPEDKSAASFFVESSESNDETNNSKRLCSDKDVSERYIKNLSPIPELDITENQSATSDDKEHDYCSSDSTRKLLNTDKSMQTSCMGSNINIELPAPTNASRFALYMLRQEFTQAPEERAQHSQDYFVINSCAISCKLTNSTKPMKYTDSFALTPKELSVCDNNLFEPENSICVPNKNYPLSKDIINKIVNSQKEYIPCDLLASTKQDTESVKPFIRCIYKRYTETELKVAETIYCLINENRETGVSYVSLLEKIPIVSGVLKLNDHLKILTSHYLLLKAGISYVRYIAMPFAKPWIISSFSIPREYRAYSAHLAMEQKQEISQNNESSDVPRSFEQGQNVNISNTNNKTSFTLLTEDKELSFNNEIIVSSSEQLNTHMEPSDKEDIKMYSNLSDVPSSHGESTGSSVHNTRKKIKNKERIKPPLLSGVTKNVYFAGRIWRKPDGSLNRPNLQKMLTLVLGYILSYPGTTESQICNHFTNVLPKIQTLEILELLQESFCIRKFILHCSNKPSLFSKSTGIEIAGEVLADDIVHYEPAVDAMAKLSQLCASLIIKH